MPENNASTTINASIIFFMSSTLLTSFLEKRLSGHSY
jgi:hypothetical protein